MAELRWTDTNEMTFDPDSRFPSIAIKLLEGRATHPNVSFVVARVAPGGEIPRHIHPIETEIAYVLSGQGKLVTESAEYPFRVGVAVTIPPGLAHGVVNDGDVPLEVLAFHTPPTR